MWVIKQKTFHSSLFYLVVNTQTKMNEAEMSVINAHKMPLNICNDLVLKKYYPLMILLLCCNWIMKA